jgi:flavodoxin
VENRVIVCYYSRTGHTKALALEIGRKLKEAHVGVRFHKLEPVKELTLLQTGARTITRASEPVVFPDIDLGSANLLIIGTPVWVGIPTPYIRSFIEQATDLKGMPVVLFATCSQRDGKAAHELRELVRGQGGRPFDYHVWRINKDGADGLQDAAGRVTSTALKMLPGWDAEPAPD